MKNKKTLYIDESGKSSLKEQVDNPFILTGVIINDSEISSIEGFFNFIKRKFEISTDIPFHSYHIFEHPREKLSDTKLIELSKTLADFISLIPAEIKIVEINKKEFKKALGVKSNNDFKGSTDKKQIPDFPYRVMASMLFGWFGEDLNKNNAIGQIICDSRKGADPNMINTLNQCKSGQVPYINSDLTRYINNRITAICFSEKNYLSGGLEITDLISYISYFRVRRLISANKHIGVDSIWEKINERTSIFKINESAIRRFFGLKKDETHKYLRK